MNSFLIFEAIKLAVISMAGWAILWAYFVVAEKWERTLFIVAHYSLSAGTFALLIWLYVRFFATTPPTPFIGMITCMVVLFMIEIIFFNFFYDKSLWFLNFTDWIVPVFIIASTIYLMLSWYAKA